MHRNFYISPLIAIVTMHYVAACTQTPAPSYKLEPPRSALMVPPKPLPPVKEGEDLYESNRSLRGQYAVEASKAASLQKYVRTILKKQKGAP
jgi:hypothetical protein